MVVALWMRERMELMRAMKESPYTLKPSECDFTPALELVGIYISHITITRMVAQGKLDMAVGTYLNGALGAHAFCVLHHCTHESISQHNPEHAQFENMVFRLGCQLLFFDDGYKEAHRAHHQRTNEADDPDLILSHTSLPVLGSLLASIFDAPEVSMLNLGIQAPLVLVNVLHKLGLTRVLSLPRVVRHSGMINWDNQVLKLICREALRLVNGAKDYQALASTVRATWRNSTAMSIFVLALFFARYPHRNGLDCANEVDSFYDSTYRAEGQVDLWMMGEGPHHMHHAKSDVSYSVLPKVCEDVEQRCPQLKSAVRGNYDVRSLERTHEMPARLCGDAPPSMQFPWERTTAIRAAKEKLFVDPKGAVANIADAVFQNAFHVCSTADRSLLCEIVKDMKLPSTKVGSDNPFPMWSWPATIFSDRTSQALSVEKHNIELEIASVAEEVGARLPAISSEADLKEHFLSFFVKLLDVMVPLSQQKTFMERMASSFGRIGPDLDRSSVLARLRVFLESPVADNFLRNKHGQSWFGTQSKGTSEKRTLARAEQLLFGPRSKL